MAQLLVARIGDVPAERGYRVLVDRLWPRGVKKVGAPWEEWIPAVAPSTGLRRWYGHDPARYQEFALRYREELSRQVGSPDFERLAGLVAARTVVLLTATRDPQWSHLPVLAEFLRDRPVGGPGGAADPV